MEALAQMYMASPDWIKILWISLPCVTLYATARLFRRGRSPDHRRPERPTQVIAATPTPMPDPLMKDPTPNELALIKLLQD